MTLKNIKRDYATGRYFSYRYRALNSYSLTYQLLMNLHLQVYNDTDSDAR